MYVEYNTGGAFDGPIQNTINSAAVHAVYYVAVYALLSMLYTLLLCAAVYAVHSAEMLHTLLYIMCLSELLLGFIANSLWRVSILYTTLAMQGGGNYLLFCVC